MTDTNWIRSGWWPIHPIFMETEGTLPLRSTHSNRRYVMSSQKIKISSVKSWVRKLSQSWGGGAFLYFLFFFFSFLSLCLVTSQLKYKPHSDRSNAHMNTGNGDGMDWRPPCPFLNLPWAFSGWLVWLSEICGHRTVLLIRKWEDWSPSFNLASFKL